MSGGHLSWSDSNSSRVPSSLPVDQISFAFLFTSGMVTDLSLSNPRSNSKTTQLETNLLPQKQFLARGLHGEEQSILSGEPVSQSPSNSVLNLLFSLLFFFRQISYSFQLTCLKSSPFATWTEFRAWFLVEKKELQWMNASENELQCCS